MPEKINHFVQAKQQVGGNVYFIFMLRRDKKNANLVYNDKFTNRKMAFFKKC